MQYIMQSLQNLTVKLQETLKVKNQGYAGVRGEFFNFEQTASMLGLDVEKTIMVRLTDKITRISNLLDSKDSMEESIEDSILDAVGYLVILNAYRLSRME